jgi:hypothetical protein
MNDLLATYSFLPWLRQGLTNKITAIDTDPKVKLRATVPFQLLLKGEQLIGETEEEDILQQNIAIKEIPLYGPGDLNGMFNKAIVKTEPRDRITNFEPNYLPYIEFYDEDFCWRYTPSAPNQQHRLRPWIMLVVLKEGEFNEGEYIQNKPLHYIECSNAANLFPPADQLWAWAHVHINSDLYPDDITSNIDPNAPDDKPEKKPINKLKEVLNENPDLACSRIICPRQLEEKSKYRAFLMPVFETGRLAGLGRDPEKASDKIYATLSAWENYPGRENLQPNNFPYYYSWEFSTGTMGDFEYLVRLLKPKPVDPRVGQRDVDVTDPAPNISGITDKALGGVLKLGGALKNPEADDGKWYDHYPHQFQTELAHFIDLADDYDFLSADKANQNAANISIQSYPDPIITAPLYGRWHALTQRLLFDRQGNYVLNDQNWVHQLNLDPRFRIASGFGTQVIQTNQEEYMNAAWEQVGRILEANRMIRMGQFQVKTSAVWHDNLISSKKVSLERTFLLTTPIHKRVIVNGTTVYYQIRNSVVPLAATSAAMRRIMRPGSRLMRSLPFNKTLSEGNFLNRINQCEITPAIPKGIPEGAISTDLVVRDLVRGQGVRWAELLLERNQRPEKVDSLPENPNFKLVSDFIITSGFEITPVKEPLGPDSPEDRFKDALKDVYSLIQASREAYAEDDRQRLDLPKLANSVLEAIDPEETIIKRIWRRIDVPEHILRLIGKDFKEVMAYPEYDIPMYKPLSDISSDLFMPNINYVEQNSITLLQTNQPFIESYMIGLNHEFARELLWREFPTDQRGSYFRQFWDVSSFFNSKGLSPEALRESLKDIPQIHEWLSSSELGDHDNREATGPESKLFTLTLQDIQPYKTYQEFIDKANPDDFAKKFKDHGYSLSATHTIESKENGKTWEVFDNKHDYIISDESGNLNVYKGRGEEVVMVIRGEILKKYPNAVIYAHRARWQMKKSELKLASITHQNIKLSYTEYKDFINNASPDVFSQKFKDQGVTLSPKHKIEVKELDKTWEVFDSQNNYVIVIENDVLNIYKGAIDTENERRLAELFGSEAKGLPTTKVKFPLFQAKVDPDIYFLGFDLTVEAAHGEMEGNEDDPGWFFVLQERAGETRFGLDIAKEGELNTWNDLAWNDITLVKGSNIDVNTSPGKLIQPKGDDNEKLSQYLEDSAISWDNDINSDSLAYILYQAPMMIAVHAREMLNSA